MASYNIKTELVRIEQNDHFNSSIPPLYQSTTFKQDISSEDNPYDYTRSGNPTRTFLEKHLCKITNSRNAYAVASGMSCLDVITRMLRPDDVVIAGDDLYGGTNRLLTFIKEKNSVSLKHIDTSDFECVKAHMNSNTKMIFLESPTNPLIKIIDLPRICKYVKNHFPGCLIVFDNTMMSPILCNPLEHGADIVYESATKYLNGHHDIMAGILYTNCEKLAKELFFVINATGCGLAPFDCWLLLRGLKTLSLRIERQQFNALKISEWLDLNYNFKTNFPGLKSHPQYAIHKSYNKGYGAVLSFQPGDIQTSEKIIKNINLYSVTVSFGCVNSLISMPCKMSHASIDPETRKERNFPEDLIRICVGIEDIDDLIADLKQALDKAGIKQKSRPKL